jgi:FMNH2-dependent dimethyl sulfone monooxygenase
MEFGVWSPVCGGWLRIHGTARDASPRSLVAYARHVERLGYDVYYVPEHHLNAVYGPRHGVVDGWVLSSMVMASTTRIRVITAVQPGFKQPGVVAKMAAAIAQFRPGAFGLGVIAGWWRLEAESYGDPWLSHAERYARAGELVDVVRGLWTKPVFDYAGSYYRVPEAQLWPKPEVLPQVTIAGESEHALELCARAGDVLFVNGDEPERVAKIVSRVKGLARERYGREVKVALSALGLVRASAAEVKARTEALRSAIDWSTVNYFDTQVDRAVIAHNRGSSADRIEANLGFNAGLCGTGDAVLARLDAFEQAGVDAVFLKFEPARKEAELFAEHVLRPYRRNRRAA